MTKIPEDFPLYNLREESIYLEGHWRGFGSGLIIGLVVGIIIASALYYLGHYA